MLQPSMSVNYQTLQVKWTVGLRNKAYYYSIVKLPWILLSFNMQTVTECGPFWYIFGCWGVFVPPRTPLRTGCILYTWSYLARGSRFFRFD